jgi:hypothetical protein
MSITFFHGGKRNNKEQKLGKKEEFQQGDRVQVADHVLNDEDKTGKVAHRLRMGKPQMEGQVFDVVGTDQGNIKVNLATGKPWAAPVAICPRFFKKHKE